MSSNANHMINLNNYEEWFVLYMDEELTAGQKAMVDAFVLQHPHLQEELDLLLGTKLSAEPMTFAAKEDLLSASMKLNTVDESLLLYIDNELPATEKSALEAKIAADATYRLQHNLLQQTKLQAADAIPYPDKKELYRHTEKVAFFPNWMRIAVAVVIMLFASLFFIVGNNKPAIDNGLAVQPKPAVRKQIQSPTQQTPETITPQDQTAAVTNVVKDKPAKTSVAKTVSTAPQENNSTPDLAIAQASVQTASVQKVEPLPNNLSKLNETSAVAVNKILANSSVTSATAVAYNPIETPDEAAGSDGDDKSAKRTSAKGFLRKVSRFIEKRTGIGTVNADNELLVGAIALKLN